MMQTDRSLAHKCTSKDRNERGQSLVEFALVLMFIILPFTFVLIDGGFMLFTLSNVTNVAREAARAGSIYQCGTAGIACTLDSTLSVEDQATTIIDPARRTYVSQIINEWLRQVPLVDPQQCTDSTHLTITYSPTTPDLGNPYRELDSITVRVVCPHRLLFGLISTGQVDLAGEATMKIEPGGVGTE